MIYEVQYIIRPREGLIALFNQYPKFRTLFGRPVIWSHNRGGYGSLDDVEFILGIKKLFLAQFRSDIIRLQLPDYEEFLAHLMDIPISSAEVFG